MSRLLVPVKAAAAPAIPLIDVFLLSALRLQEPAQTRARMHHKHKQARIVVLVSLQEAAQTQARMHHKYKHARNMNPLCGGSLEGCGCSRREVLEVASFVPGHVRDRGATPWSWTALCSKKNKVATPFGLGPHGAATLG